MGRDSASYRIESALITSEKIPQPFAAMNQMQEHYQEGNVADFSVDASEWAVTFQRKGDNGDYACQKCENCRPQKPSILSFSLAEALPPLWEWTEMRPDMQIWQQHKGKSYDDVDDHQCDAAQSRQIFAPDTFENQWAWRC